jgi:hypothetical protein
VVVTVRGRLSAVSASPLFGKIVEIDAIADPDRTKRSPPQSSARVMPTPTSRRPL